MEKKKMLKVSKEKNKDSSAISWVETFYWYKVKVETVVWLADWFSMCEIIVQMIWRHFRIE